MAIAIMSRVWRESTQRGSRLLLLLCLADMANEESGECWPSVQLLAKRCRQTVRQTQRCLRALEKAKEIRTTRRDASGQTTLYKVLYIGGVTSPSGVTSGAKKGPKCHPEPKGTVKRINKNLLQSPPSIDDLNKSRVYTRYGAAGKLIAYDTKARTATAYVFERRMEKEFAAHDLFWHRPSQVRLANA